MEDREMPRMRKYGESKMTQIMMANVCHITAWAMYEILGRWIFVPLSVPVRIPRGKILDLLHLTTTYQSNLLTLEDGKVRFLKNNSQKLPLQAL